MPVVLELISQPIMCIPVYKQWLQHAENLQGTWLHPLNSYACLHAGNPEEIFHVHTERLQQKQETKLQMPQLLFPKWHRVSVGGKWR